MTATQEPRRGVMVRTRIKHFIISQYRILHSRAEIKLFCHRPTSCECSKKTKKIIASTKLAIKLLNQYI